MDNYVKFFRDSSPYINMHRGKTFVIAIGGEGLRHGNFHNIIHDIALLNSLGIKIVLVHGARPQIDERLSERGLALDIHNGQRVTNEEAMTCVKEAAGSTRIGIEAMLSLGLANSPMHGSRLRVISGNFVSAKPVGVRDGIDFHLTGEVRKVDTQGISKQLNEGAVVLLSPLGYSATGEAFNLTYESVATEVAIALAAEKLVLFSENQGLVDSTGAQTKLLPLMEAESLIEQQPRMKEKHLLVAAATACKRGVPRTHLIGFDQDGALLKELFTRSGEGTLILQNGRETIRQAALDDIPGLLEIIAPLEEAGVLVKRSRELLEAEISRFYLLVDAENIVVACAALYPFPDHNAGELACVATHGDYKNKGFAARLLEHIEKQARQQGLTQLFVLTTQTAHWFLEQGFEPSSLDRLPKEKQVLYNYTRKSKIFVKAI